MDPTKCLDEIRTLLEELTMSDEPSDDDVEELMIKIEALDNWMTGGGFLPDQWKALR